MAGDSNYGDRRKIVNIFTAPFRPYDMEGKVEDDKSYIPLTYDRGRDMMGSYVIRMKPGAAFTPHTHRWNEDYLIIEGDLIESDGHVLGAGDFVHYDPGTRHSSRTEKGCLLIACDWGVMAK